MLYSDTPRVFVFNPTSDYAVANGDENWQANRVLQKMEEDLALLPLYFAGKNDFVLAPEPCNDFLVQLTNLGIEIPNFIQRKSIPFNQKLLETKNIQLAPWGWSPAVHKLFRPIKTNCSEDFKSSPVFTWKPESKKLYSKAFAQTVLRELLGSFTHSSFIEAQYLPKICSTKTQIEELLMSWEKIMIKVPWSSSGRGLQPITKTPVHEKVWEKIQAIIKEQRDVIVEPYLNKAYDFALQFELKKGNVRYIGLSNFITDRKGQYSGNHLNGIPKETEKELAEFVKNSSEFLVEPLIQTIARSELASGYEGFFGIDTLVYRDKNNQLKINPCLEINLRMNMGLLSLQLEKLLHERKPGLFKLYYNPNQTYYEFKLKMEQDFPLKIKNNKIEAGFFSLTDAGEKSEFGAYIIV